VICGNYWFLAIMASIATMPKGSGSVEGTTAISILCQS